jgi:RimJ/RimL family protein N-acetyltransferase
MTSDHLILCSAECHHHEVARLPEVLSCEGLELRRWDPAFAEPMLRAIRRSFAELQRWMSWAREVPNVDELREVLMQGRMAFDANRAWEYAIFDKEAQTERVVGCAGVHASDRPDRYEIGYWVRSDRTGRGIATATTATLVDAALTYLGEARQVVIRMDRANQASAAVPRKLGFTLDHEEDRAVVASGHTGRGLVWVRDRIG